MHCLHHPGPDRRDDEVGTATRALLLLAALAAAAVAVGAGQAPASAGWTLPWALPALHARCLAALHAATALTWLRAALERDRAAVRIPLAQLLAQAGTTAALLAGAGMATGAPAPAGPAALAWCVSCAVAALLAAWRLVRQAELQAPAERPDRALQAFAVLAGAAALLLALDPQRAATVWPWPLGPAPARLYVGPWAGWAVALWMAAHERRRSGRRWVLWGLVVLGPLVVLASAWHRAAFPAPALAIVWSAGFAAASVLAGWRLRPPGSARRRRGFRPARPSVR